MTKLSVNVNKIATLRNTRPHLQIPDLVRLSRIAIEAGAAGITIHPRPDERHIKSADVDAIARLIENLSSSTLSPFSIAPSAFAPPTLAPLATSSGRGAGGDGSADFGATSTSYAGIEFNIEGNPFEGEYVAHCLRVKPTQCTLVPDSLSQSTSDHGWNLPHDIDRLRPVVESLKLAGCRVSLFMDPITDAMPFVVQTGADRVELYTELYAVGYAQGEANAALQYKETAKAACALGLGINAGHDLNLDNLGYFLENVPNVLEVSIGHALIADALEFGLYETVTKYRTLCQSRKK